MFLTVCWMTRLLTTHTVIHMLQCTALAASKRCTHEIIKYTWIWQKSLLKWGPYFAIVQSKTVQILWNHCKHGKIVYLNWKTGLFLKPRIRTVNSGTLNPVLFWRLEGESTFILEYLKKNDYYDIFKVRLSSPNRLWDLLNEVNDLCSCLCI